MSSERRVMVGDVPVGGGALLTNPRYLAQQGSADKAIAVGLLGRGNYGEIPLSQAVARARPFQAVGDAPGQGAALCRRSTLALGGPLGRLPVVSGSAR
jgi:hypothetical protein